MSFAIEKPRGQLNRVGKSPLTEFYEGVCPESVETCLKRLEHAAGTNHLINLRFYPMTDDIHAFMLVVTAGGRVFGNGLGSLHRLDGSSTKVIYEAPRYSLRDVLVGVLILSGLVVLGLLDGIRPADKGWLLLIAILFIVPLLRRQHQRYTTANQMLDFVRSALQIS